MPSVTLGALEIAYHEWGSGDPILLINGTGESGATWLPQAERLAERWRCIAIDNRDTGRSSYVERPYTPQEMAGDAAGLIDTLRLGECHVVGYSLGGATAQELALARPDLVRSLVLLATWPSSDGWFVSQMRSWQALRHAHWDDDDEFFRALAPWLFAPATFERAGEAERLLAFPDRIGETPQRPDGWIRQCDADIAHDAGPRLHRVTAPALAIVGADDICTPPRYTRKLAELLPDMDTATIPSAGHAAPLERPDEVTRAIAGFIERH